MTTQSLTSRTLFLAALTLASAAILVPVTASAAAIRIDGFAGRRVNNQQQILGSSDTKYGEGYQPPVIWQNGTRTALPGPVSAFNLDVDAPLSEDGEAIGLSYDFGNLPTATKIGIVRTRAGSWSKLLNTDESTQLFYLANGELAEFNPDTYELKSGKRTVNVGNSANVVFAADGSFIVDSRITGESDWWYPAAGERINIGAYGYYAMGSGGHIAAFRYSNPTIVRITVDPLKRTVATTEYALANSYYAGHVINGKGTLVWGTRASSDYESLVTFMRARAGGQPENLTPQLGSAAPALRTVYDINEWGDIVLSGVSGSVEAGFKGTTVLVGDARSSITGQVSPTTVASGRSVLRAASLAGRTVTITKGDSALTGTTNAKGVFTIAVPAGSGYVLTAPAGYCVITSNGCHTSTPLPTIGVKGKAISLTKVAAPALAAFEHKAKAKLRLDGRGRVAVKVRCRAATTCKVTVSFKKGRKSYGSASTSIKKGKVKVVMVTINSSGRSAAGVRGGVAVGANLAMVAGKTRANTALSVKLTK